MIYNIQQPPLDWVALNFDQTISRGQTHFTISSSGSYKNGNSILSNCLSILNNKIKLAWFNQSLPAFKIIKLLEHCNNDREICLFDVRINNEKPQQHQKDDLDQRTASNPLFTGQNTQHLTISN